jgi:hypothetical protein
MAGLKSQYEYRIQYEQQYVQEETIPALNTPEDCHKYAMFVKGNEHFDNGRTYVFKDEFGKYVSTFVSQYSDIMEKNLEPGVRDAVLALQQKGYLTFTSCQGHADSKHRYIGVVFNDKAQKGQFMHEMKDLRCDIHWYDNTINSEERPCKNIPWWSEGGITLHIVYDDHNYDNMSQMERREKPYTDEELTKFWNIQMWRNYKHYECIVFSFGYPMVEKSIWERIHKYFFYNQFKVESAYKDFLLKVDKLTEYLA